MTSRFCRATVTTLLAGFLAVVASVMPAGAADPSALVARAIEKLGGAQQLSDIATLSISGRSKHWDPGNTRA